jgi:hypothetical protein
MVVFAYCLALYIEVWIVAMRGCELRLISFRPVVVYASGEVPVLIGRVALPGRRRSAACRTSPQSSSFPSSFGS